MSDLTVAGRCFLHENPPTRKVPQAPLSSHPLLKGDRAQSSFEKEVPRNEAEDFIFKKKKEAIHFLEHLKYQNDKHEWQE